MHGRGGGRRLKSGADFCGDLPAHWPHTAEWFDTGEFAGDLLLLRRHHDGSVRPRSEMILLLSGLLLVLMLLLLGSGGTFNLVQIHLLCHLREGGNGIEGQATTAPG